MSPDSRTRKRMAETADSDLYDVIILGAGLTGLGLARLLTQHAKRPSFLVLEARDRVGGRIHSVETTDGATVEMGATWFFPPFRNMFKMLKELKVELGEQYLKGYVMYESDPNSPPNKVNIISCDLVLPSGFLLSELLHRR